MPIISEKFLLNNYSLFFIVDLGEKKYDYSLSLDFDYLSANNFISYSEIFI